MAKRPKQSEKEILEQDRVALENAETQPEIAKEMSELGFDSEKISEGKGIHAETSKKYDFNKQEDDETSEAHDVFEKKCDEMYNIFTLHWKKAKAVFLKDPVTADKLAITGAKPRNYINWMETMKKFYSVATSDIDIQTKLARLKVSVKELKQAQKKISEIEKARAEYLREEGESQDATKQKDAAFKKLEDWMREFWAVARIALEDRPQLLESLGKVVRS